MARRSPQKSDLPGPSVAMTDASGVGDQAAAQRSGSRRHGKSSSRPDHVEVRIGDVLVHRCPPVVARSLRYLLASGELPARVSVTSSLHGEGVTSISRSLAALIANDWRKSACWIDLNWWKIGAPKHESTLFDMTVVDVVEGVGLVADLPMPTSIPGLSMVAAGNLTVASRTRMPRSEALFNLIHELARSFDYLVFDLPPVLASSDAVTLSGLSDGYLLVVRQRATSSVQIMAALQTVNSVPCLGTILNGTRSNIPRWLRTSNEVWALGT